MKVLDGDILFYSSHIERLVKSWERIYGELSRTEIEELKKRIEKIPCSRKNGFLKVVLFGIDEKSRDAHEGKAPKIGITSWTGDFSLSSKLEFRVRKRESFRDRFVKETSYGVELKDIRNNKTKCLYINENEDILETTFANIVFFKDKKVIFPKSIDSFYEGLTLSKFKEFLQKSSIEFEIRNIKVKELPEFSGSIALSSLLLASPVNKIDEISFDTMESKDICDKFWAYGKKES